MKKSIAGMVWIPLVLSFVTLGIIIFITYDTSTLENLKKVNVVYLVSAFLLHVLAWACWCARMRFLSRGMGWKISFRDSIDVLMPSLFVATITPSAAGGEPVRIYILSKKGLSYGGATAVIATGRILDLFLVVSLGMFFTLILGTVIENEILKALMGITAILIGTGFFLLLTAVLKPELFKRFMGYVLRKIKKESVIDRVCYEIDDFRKAITLLVREGKREIIASVIATGGYWILDLIIPWVILLGLGIYVSPLKIVFLHLLVYVIILTPITPGSSGLAETSASLLFSSVIRSSVLGVFVFVWRFILYYFTMIVGFLMGIKMLKNRQLLEKEGVIR